MTPRRFSSIRGDDPGDAWVDALLEPLRRAEVRCDVASGVMARVTAARRPSRPIIRQPLLTWASSAAAAAVAAYFLALPLVGLARHGGLSLRHGRVVLETGGRVAWLLGAQIRSFIQPAVAAVAPLLHTLVTLLDVAAPIFKSAAAVAATTGFVSILISLYVFAHARGTAPPAGARGGFFPNGGTR